MQKLIIDTDPGQDIDDLLAIWFALLRPELDIKAITTVTWPSDKRARLVRRLLRYLDRADAPVGAGMQLPLRPVSAEEWANQQKPQAINHYCFAEPEDPRDGGPYPDAVDLLIRTVEANSGEIALACLAPLTNIACALRRRPDIAPMVQYIALMGGETALYRTEHNIAYDYIAADIVFRSGIPIFMGTWDITRRFVLTVDDCRRIKAGPSELHRAMGQAIEVWHPFQSWKPSPFMYDLYPLVHATGQKLYTTKPTSIQIETTGATTRGMTIATSGAPNAEVTVGIDEAKVRELYLSTVCPG